MVAGVDLGGTKILVGLADLQGRILARAEEPTEHGADAPVLRQIPRMILSLLQENRETEAELAYRAAIDADPNSSFAWDGLGLVLQRRLQRNEARDAFERAVQLNPLNATAWLHLGYAFELLQNPSGAVNAYRQALAITPQRGDAIEMYQAALRRYR